MRRLSMTRSPHRAVAAGKLGFCKHGEATTLYSMAACGLDGRCPQIPHGGQLSEAYIHGVNGIVEAARLVRGTSVNQPRKPVNHALVTAGVGVPTGALLGSMDTL